MEGLALNKLCVRLAEMPPSRKEGRPCSIATPFPAHATRRRRRYCKEEDEGPRLGSSRPGMFQPAGAAGEQDIMAATVNGGDELLLHPSSDFATTGEIFFATMISW